MSALATDGKLYYYIPVSSTGSVPVDLSETFKVFAFGVSKHGDKGFHTGTVSQSSHFYACLRHLWKWFLKFPKDDETGLSHLHHAHCRLLMMIYQSQHEVNDDRKSPQLELFTGITK